MKNECHLCKEVNRWWRNCAKYLEHVKKNKAAKDIHVIEINVATHSKNDCVFDTGAMIHTFKLLQGLARVKRFASGEVDLRVRNIAKVFVLAIGTYPLSLPSGLVLELNNCYCIPALNKYIIPLHVWEMMVMTL